MYLAKCLDGYESAWQKSTAPPTLFTLSAFFPIVRRQIRLLTVPE